MIDDLLYQELEVVKAFFARALAWAATESAAESVRLEGASEDLIEHTVLHPHGPYSYEQIVIRSTINELNALCDFSLQTAWTKKDGCSILPTKEHVFSVSRATLERQLASVGLDVKLFPRWNELEKIKELSEGFKHRQRMQPLPTELHKTSANQRSRRVVDPSNTDWMATYSIHSGDVAESIAAVEELFRWLRARDAL